MPVAGSNEIVFGKFQKEIFANMSQNSNLQDKAQAFETAHAILVSNSEGLQELEFINFLLPYLRDSQTAPSITLWTVRILNSMLKIPSIHKKVNILKLAQISVHRLSDSSKFIREEAESTFKTFQTIIKPKVFIICMLECFEPAKTSSYSLATKE